jgi:hypothetical protein
VEPQLDWADTTSVRYAVIAVSTFVVGAFLTASVLYFASAGIGRPLRHELPAGFRGWALIEYEQTNCPELYVRGIRLIIPYDARGRACTSSPRPLGWRYQSFVYVEPSGMRRPIPEEMLWSYSYSNTDDVFFVGTEAARSADRTPVVERHRRK